MPEPTATTVIYDSSNLPTHPLQNALGQVNQWERGPMPRDEGFLAARIKYLQDALKWAQASEGIIQHGIETAEFEISNGERELAETAGQSDPESNRRRREAAGRIEAGRKGLALWRAVQAKDKQLVNNLIRRVKNLLAKYEDALKKIRGITYRPQRAEAAFPTAIHVPMIYVPGVTPGVKPPLTSPMKKA